MLETFFTFYSFILMFFIAAIHIYWFKGGFWPASNKQEFIDMFLGRGEEVPGFFAYIFVIIVFIIMAFLPLFPFYKIDLNINYTLIFYILSFIFFLRSISVFIPQIAARATDIFLEYNKKYYAPLCFSLSLAYLYLGLF